MAPPAEMTPKERWLAAMALQPVDRLPFWPKLDAAYTLHREAPFRGLSLAQLHEWVGSDQHEGVGSALREVRTSTGVAETRTAGERRTVFRTPYGELLRVDRFDPISQSWHPMCFPVRTVADLKAMAAWYADCRPELDREALQQARQRHREIGAAALVTTGLGQSPLMHWVEWLAGIENAHYLLHDHRDEVLALFTEMHRVLLRRAEILAEHHPADAFYMVENTSTTLISAEQYRTVNLPQVMSYARVMRVAGRHLLLHMCGHLKAILPDLAGLPCSGFEAFTAPALGDTTLLDGRSTCPDKCLIGGTQAPDWVQPADVIIAALQRSLDELPHHRGIVVTSAGVMPPRCPPEVIGAVRDWVVAYPHRN